MAKMNTGADPGEHTVEEVLAHLAEADDDEKSRVFDAERAGKARRGVLGAAPFDPSEHTVDEVNDHLAKSDDTEQYRVLALEEGGKARKGILDATPKPASEQAEHSSFVDAAHSSAGHALELANELEEALAELTTEHAAVIGEHAPDPGEEAVWHAHNRVGFALTDMGRPIAALRATAGDVRNETSTRGAVDPEPDDDEAA